MNMTYEDELLSPDVSWDLITQKKLIPPRLYKYQSFFDIHGYENPYWSANIKGQFHMSLGCEFEDINDCKPFFNKGFIFDYIKKFFINFNTDAETVNKILTDINNMITEKYLVQVMNNYQKNIRIGCFTDTPCNNEMWDKYAFQKSGYCIEYDTSKNSLFSLSTLPILYSDKPYDSSLTLVNSLIIECIKNAKQYSMEEILSRFDSIYKKILKTTYIPIFIKNKKVWQFEHEYRMFLLENRNTRDGSLKAKDYLDNNYNIDLSKAISAVYLGENFNKNKGHDALLDNIIMICHEKGINLFRKEIKNGNEIDTKIDTMKEYKKNPVNNEYSCATEPPCN